MRGLSAFLGLMLASNAHAFGGYNMGAFWRASSNVLPNPSWVGVYLSSHTSFSTQDYVSESSGGDGVLYYGYASYSSGSYLYVGDECRVNRFNMTNNTYDGWIGWITTTPTGGDAGCSGASTNAFTPGWCKGGSCTRGSNDGQINNSKGIMVVGTHLYVTSGSEHKINRYSLTTGARAGWYGGVTSSPTGGDAGCTGLAAFSVTPAWCRGGTSSGPNTGNGIDGILYNPTSLTSDGTYIYVSDKDNNRITRITLAGSPAGWIGGVSRAKTDWTSTGFLPVAGPSGSSISADGMFDGPWGLATDGSYGYMADSYGNARIIRYLLSDGSFKGWIGKVGSSNKPTAGAAGCSTVASNTNTPGWCYGGYSTTGTADGQFTRPGGVATDGSYLYIAETNTGYRLSRFTIDGVFQGWVGKVGSQPTAGAAGCSGASVNSTTPGWCYGGAGTSGTGDGHLSNPGGTAVDASYVYVADYGNHRVNRYDKNTGASSGWIGKIYTTAPTGGAAGCTSTTSAPTPGWCYGGTSTNSTTGDGSMYNPYGVTADATYLYVAMSQSHQVSRYDLSTGAFGGWIGWTSGLPTGGDAGCTGASSRVTPGWCMGGSGSSSNPGAGGLGNASAVHFSGSNLYIANSSNAIARYSISPVAFTGWIGKISTTPTAGDAGCSGAAVGTITPGWCKGGSPNNGTIDGAFNSVYGMAVDGTSIYFADSSNNRVQKFGVDGSYVGWIGREYSTYSNWGSVGVARNSASGDGYFSTPRGVSNDGTYLYVSDYGNQRVQKFNLNGTVIGWTGKISGTPTGGAAGCSSTSSGPTPGWCLGGTANSSSSGDGGPYYPEQVTAAAGYVYLASPSSYSVLRYNATSGLFSGWIGYMETSPTGGDPGCSGAPKGTGTPGWCKGGIQSHGYAPGTFISPTGVSSDGSSLFVMDDTNMKLDRIDLATGQSTGWLGKSRVFSGFGTGSSAPSSGKDDGALNSPQAAGHDGTYFYALDTYNYRLQRYDTNGAAQGWAGYVATFGYPTGGDAGCAGTKNAHVPGWCMGGRSTYSGYTGYIYTPTSAILVGSYFYIVDGTAVIRYNKNTGQSAGWIGKVSGQPTGGDTNCSTTTSGNFTPGWCRGGSVTNGTGDGHLSSPKDITTDGTYFYVMDSSNYRVNRYLFTGAFQGWIGKINSVSPTAGDAGCSGAATGNMTPGWCYGGNSSSGTGDGHFGSANGLGIDSDYLYVADTGNYRVTRYNRVTGLAAGWIGKVAGTAPTGGDAGCTSTTNAFTPGWCRGGNMTVASTTENGAFTNPHDVEVKGNYLYVSDSSRNRLNRYTPSTGAFKGWIGMVSSSSPTGGDAGCTSTAVSSATPGWCYGGGSANGTGNGMFYSPQYMMSTGSNLFISDTNNNRIIRISIP